MGLFDAFSADDEVRKFEQGLKYQTGQIGQADQRLSQNFDKARGYLTSADDQGINYLTDQNAIARGDITGAQDMGMGMLQQGADTAAGFYDQALTPWQQLSDMGTQGVQDHYNLISNPDSIYDSELYKSREQATIDALNREANSRGMLASGNNSIDIINKMREGGLDYFKSLMGEYAPYFGLATGGAAGIGNILGQKAGLYDRLGQNQAGLAQWAGGQNATGANQLGANLANHTTNIAGQLADNREQEGQLLNTNRLGAGQAGADAYGNIANAGNNADAMGWNALLGITNGIGGGLANYVGAGGRFA
jgi:hypothetical protein